MKASEPISNTSKLSSARRLLLINLGTSLKAGLSVHSSSLESLLDLLVAVLKSNLLPWSLG
jgi:hypothetical protein